MPWGIEIYDDRGKPIKITGSSFILDQFNVTMDGSRTYSNIPHGKTLSISAINISPSITGTLINVNGNTVSWKCGNNANVVVMVMIT